MEPDTRRRVLLLASLSLLAVVVLQKRWVQLALVLGAYYWSKSLFGVDPYTPVELVDFFTSNIEATVAFAGLIIAFAAGRGFIESKQLDLRLGLESDIANLSEDVSQLLSVHRRVAVALVEVTREGRSAVEYAIATNSPNVPFPPAAGLWFRELLVRAKSLPEANQAIALIDERFREISRKSGPLVRSSLVTSLCLNRAQAAFNRILPFCSLIQIDDTWSIEAFLIGQAQHPGASPEQFLAALDEDELWFQGWMGGASAVGTGSIFRPSILIATLMWWHLWKMRE